MRVKRAPRRRAPHVSSKTTNSQAAIENDESNTIARAEASTAASVNPQVFKNQLSTPPQTSPNNEFGQSWTEVARFQDVSRKRSSMDSEEYQPFTPQKRRKTFGVHPLTPVSKIKEAVEEEKGDNVIYVESDKEELPPKEPGPTKRTSKYKSPGRYMGEENIQEESVRRKPPENESFYRKQSYNPEIYVPVKRNIAMEDGYSHDSDRSRPWRKRSYTQKRPVQRSSPQKENSFTELLEKMKRSSTPGPGNPTDDMEPGGSDSSPPEERRQPRGRSKALHTPRYSLDLPVEINEEAESGGGAGESEPSSSSSDSDNGDDGNNNPITTPETPDDNSVPMEPSERIKEVLFPYLALGFCPVSHPAINDEVPAIAEAAEGVLSGVYALHTAWMAACVYHNINPNLSNINVEKREDITPHHFRSVLLTTTCQQKAVALWMRKFVAKYGSINHPEARRELRSRVSSWGSWLDAEALLALLRSVNEEFGTNFNLGIVYQGFRGRLLDGGGCDEEYLYRTHGRFHNERGKQGDGQPWIWLYCDNEGKRSEVPGLEEKLEDRYLGFARWTRDTMNTIDFDAGTKLVREWKIANQLRDEVKYGFWQVMEDCEGGSGVEIDGEKWELLDVKKGHFLRYVFLECNWHIPKGYWWMRLAGTRREDYEDDEDHDFGVHDTGLVPCSRLLPITVDKRAPVPEKGATSRCAKLEDPEIDIESFMEKTGADHDTAEIFLDHVAAIRSVPEYHLERVMVDVFTELQKLEKEFKRLAPPQSEGNDVENVGGNSKTGSPLSRKNTSPRWRTSDSPGSNKRLELFNEGSSSRPKEASISPTSKKGTKKKSSEKTKILPIEMIDITRKQSSTSPKSKKKPKENDSQGLKGSHSSRSRRPKSA